MNEIEKMYKIAGVEYYDRYFSCLKDEDLTCQDNCEICDNAKEVKCYPSFTAEKQVELYCFILSQEKYIMRFEASIPLTPDVFAEGIAEATNRIWQDLTPEEKQQIREILE